MKFLSVVFILLCAGLVSAADSPPAAAAKDAKLHVLIITGGHGFPQEPFYRMFREIPGLEVSSLAHTGKSADAWDRADLSGVDVVVLYDAPKVYTPEQRARFSAMFTRGTGLVVLHHALLLDHDWPDYERIIGGAYPTRPTKGAPPVGYRGDVDIPVVIAQRDHPITAGLKDFIVRDEIYWGFRVGSDVTPLLTTTHPDSGKPLAWTRTEGKSRVFFTQLGHACFDDPNYRTLVTHALRWAAERPTK